MGRARSPLEGYTWAVCDSGGAAAGAASAIPNVVIGKRRALGRHVGHPHRAKPLDTRRVARREAQSRRARNKAAAPATAARAATGGQGDSLSAAAGSHSRAYNVP